MDSSEEPRGFFLVIDNKSFYATIECTMRGLDPLTTPLVVMSEAENTNGGLVLASSPTAKKLYGISNVNRQRDLPRDNHLMWCHRAWTRILRKTLRSTTFIASSWRMRISSPYSIDESILDITHSWKLFGDDPIEVVQKIQKTVHDRLKLVTTVGVGENPAGQDCVGHLCQAWSTLHWRDYLWHGQRKDLVHPWDHWRLGHQRANRQTPC